MLQPTNLDLSLSSKIWKFVLVNKSRQGYHKHQATNYFYSLPPLFCYKIFSFSILVKWKAYNCQIIRKVWKKPIDVILFIYFSIHFFVNIRDDGLVQKYKSLIMNKIGAHFE